MSKLTKWRNDLGSYFLKNFIQETLNKYNNRITNLETENSGLKNRIEILETYYKDLKSEINIIENNSKADFREVHQEMRKTFYVTAKLEGAIETFKLMRNQDTNKFKDGNHE